MRISVACSAFVEFEPGVSRLAVITIRVALDATNRKMGTAKRILSRGVIEAALPVDSVVTLRAVRSQLAMMFVFVAGDATSGKS